MESRLLLLMIAMACAVSCIEGVTITPGTPNITRTGCSSTKLCFATCDPVSNISSCYFGSSKASDANNSLIFELSGPTTGFVALGLDASTPGGNSIMFVCGNNNNTNPNISSFVFRTGSENTVQTVQGAVVNQSYIQCTFNTTTNLTVTRSLGISYYVSIFNGTMNGSDPGTPNTIFKSMIKVDLTNSSSNPFATANNTTNTTTATPVQSTTKAGSDSLASSAARALAILLSAMGLLLMY